MTTMKSRRDQIAADLQKLASENKGSKAAQLRRVIDDVEDALAGGASRRQVVDVLAKNGLVFTVRSFETTLARIRKEKDG